jgi:hypothetical protein
MIDVEEGLSDAWAQCGGKSCDLRTKSSLELNCYFTAVYIHTKLALGVALLVPPTLRGIVHTNSQVKSFSHSSVRSIDSPPSEVANVAEQYSTGVPEW